MLYIWSYLKKYPKWLFLDFFGAIFFVIVNLGLPTVLARMIDEGVNKGNEHHAGDYPMWNLGAYSLSLRC